MPGQRFAEEQGVQRRNHDEPERDPDDGVTFPDHRPGDVRVAEQFEQARVHAGVHVEEPAEIDDVHERGRGENRSVQQVDQATEASAADQKALKRRDAEDERNGDEPEYDHANIELRTDVQGVQDVGSGVPGHFRPEDAEHGSSRQHKRQQRANKKDAEGADKRGEERCLLHFFCIGRARENVKYLEKVGKRTGRGALPARNDRSGKLWKSVEALGKGSFFEEKHSFPQLASAESIPPFQCWSCLSAHYSLFRHQWPLKYGNVKRKCSRWTIAFSRGGTNSGRR